MTFTEKKKAQFIEILGQTGNVSRTARACRVSRGGSYEARKKDPEFAAAWDSAVEEYADFLEEECDRRALAGSDTLLIFRLKALRPEVYRERFDNRIRAEVNIFSDRSTEDLIAIAQESLKGEQED